jgi:cation diffusion facilitator family transporter
MTKRKSKKLLSESVSLVSVGVNLILVLLKVGVGLIVKSTGLIADGIHSGLDIVSSGITYLGIKIAKRPADRKHPYGHYRFETIAGFVVTFLLLFSAIWIIKEGIESIINQKETYIGVAALFVAGLSIVVNAI